MTAQDTNPSVFFVQLSDVAPAISNLLKTHTARIRASVTTHDVVNGYGIGFTYHAFIEILIHKCQRCGEHEYSTPHFDCTGHRYQVEWLEVASAEGRDFQDALRNAEAVIAERKAA